MKLNERIVWVVVIALGGFYINKQEIQIKELEKAVSYNTDFELKNLQRKVFYEMLLDSIEMQQESNDQYNELLEVMTSDDNQ
tara:strand:- start:8546 stop:8791 length:246 start_codon:yes stop_codon:yes gene_type:complete